MEYTSMPDTTASSARTGTTGKQSLGASLKTVFSEFQSELKAKLSKPSLRPQGPAGSDSTDWLSEPSQFRGKTSTAISAGCTPEVDDKWEPDVILLYLIREIFGREGFQADYRFTLSWREVKGSQTLSGTMKREIIQVGVGYNTASIGDGLVQDAHRELDEVTEKSLILLPKVAKKLNKITRAPVYDVDPSLTNNVMLKMEIRSQGDIEATFRLA